MDNFYALDPSSREKCLKENKVTNYSVVRLPLLEQVYEKLYRQELIDSNPANWPLRLFSDREIVGLTEGSSGSRPQVRLQMRHTRTGEQENTEAFDSVVFATGYKNNSTSGILKQLEPLLDAAAPGEYTVDRNYRLKFHDGKVGRDAGVWLQGWCESTHGVSSFPENYGEFANLFL